MVLTLPPASMWLFTCKTSKRLRCQPTLATSLTRTSSVARRRRCGEALPSKPSTSLSPQRMLYFAVHDTGGAPAAASAASGRSASSA